MNVVTVFNRPAETVDILDRNSVIEILGNYLKWKYAAPNSEWRPLLKRKGAAVANPVMATSTWNTFEDEKYAESTVYIEITGLAIQNAVGKGSPVPKDWSATYSTAGGLKALKERIKTAIQNKKTNERQAKELSEQTETDVKEFVLYAGKGRTATQLTDDNALALLLQSSTVYFDYAIHPYSRMSDMILEKFTYAFTQPPKNQQLYGLLKKNNTHEAELAANTFLERMKLPVNAHLKSRWDEAVHRATECLKDYALTIPVLKVYNEATRRLLINPIVQQASKYLAANMLVEPYLCKDQKRPPSHFVGTGPLDFVSCIAGTTGKLAAPDNATASMASATTDDLMLGPGIELFPSDSQAKSVAAKLQGSLAEVYVEESEGEEGEGWAEESEGAAEPAIVEIFDDDAASAAVVLLPDTTTGVIEEAKQWLGLAAVKQLMAQHYDRFFVSDDDLMELAKNVEDAREREWGFESGELGPEPVGVKAGGVAKRKREDHPELRRAHQKVHGILTTGQTWQVYRFSALEGAGVLPRMEFIGEFRVPVLQDRRTNGASGATPTAELSPEAVARVMAVLVLAAQKEL